MKCTTPKLWPQYLLTFLCNIGTLTFGLHTGWLAPLHLRFMSDDSPLGRDQRLTTEEISWIGSIPSISFFFGTVLYGFLLQRIGRKMSALFAVIPNIVCFFILIFACNVYMIYFARFVAGFASAGSLLITPVYVNESASNEVRSFLCGLSAFFVNTGLVIASAAGGYFPYWLFNTVCLSFSSIFVLSFFWLPETPAFLIIKGRKKEAEEALRKLRWGNEIEICKLYRDLRDSDTSSKSLKELLSDGAFTYLLFLSVGVMSVHQLSGYSPITTYSAKVFHDAGSNLPPALASTITSVVLLLGSILGAWILDRAGRKIVLVISLAVMAATLSILSAFTYLENIIPDGFAWVSSAALFIYMGTFASGIGSVSFVLITELFQPDVRGISGAICGTWTSILGFTITKFFPVIVERISLTPVLAFFALCCTIGVIFTSCFLVETRGKTTGEIVRLMRGKSMGNVFEMSYGEYNPKCSNSRGSLEKI